MLAGGNHVLTEEILRHQRDLCWNGQQTHTYGAIDAPRFITLASRYLKTASNFVPKDVKDIDDKIKQGFGVFVFATNYNGNSHAMRAVAVAGQKIVFLIPGIPYGLREEVDLNHVLQSWSGSFIEVQ